MNDTVDALAVSDEQGAQSVNAAALTAKKAQKEKVQEDHLVETYLSFFIGVETYGIEIRRVKEIIEFGGVTKVPMASDIVEGVINLRGNVVPVINLAKRMSQEMPEYDKRTCIVMVEVMIEDEPAEVGFVVSAVAAVLDIHKQDIEPKPSFGCSINTEFIKGMARRDQHFLTLLNLDTLFDSQSLISLI